MSIFRRWYIYGMQGNERLNAFARTTPKRLTTTVSVLIPIYTLILVCALSHRPISPKSLDRPQTNQAIEHDVRNRLEEGGSLKFTPPIWVEKESTIWQLMLSSIDKYLAVVTARTSEERRYRVRVLEMQTRQVVVDVPAFSRLRICFSPASDSFAVFSAGTYPFSKTTRGIASLYSLIDRAKTTEMDVTGPGNWQMVEAIGLSKNGTKLAVQPFSQSRTAWDWEAREPIEFDEGDSYRWSGAGLSPDGSLYSIGGWPGPGVRIRSSKTDELVGFCLRDALPAISSSFSDDNRLWATGYDDGVFAIWDIQSDSRGPLLKKTGFDHCTAFALSHALNQLVVAIDDGTIRLLPLKFP